MSLSSDGSAYFAGVSWQQTAATLQLHSGMAGYSVREIAFRRAKLWAAHLVICFVQKGKGPEARMYSDSRGVTNGWAGCQDAESLEDQGQGSLVKRHANGPMGKGTKCEDLCTLMPLEKRHQITRHNNDLASCHQPASVIHPSRAGPMESSHEGRMEIIHEPKTKVSQLLLLLLNSHAASKKPILSPQYGTASQGDHSVAS